MNNKMTIGLLALLLTACGGGEQATEAPPAAPAEESPAAGYEEITRVTEAKVTSWIVESGEPVPESGIESVTGPVIPGAVTVEPLFPDTPDLRGMYIVRADRAFSEREAFDIAYRLKDLPEITDAAPNFAVHEPDMPREAAAACRDDGSQGVPGEHGWSLARMRVQKAWLLEPAEGGERFGEGVTICHPDSGWAEHVEYDAEAIDKEHSIDLIDDGGTGEDPLNYSGHPGHGTATGSVIASRGDVDDDGNTEPSGGVTGVAPRARIIPIRTLKSVAMFLDSNTARAVNYARGQSCDVVSMSLGGAGFFGLKKVIRKAVDEDDKIVVSAAGNCVGWVVAPAKYDSTVAAAASNWNSTPWKGSSKGRAVAMTAPGEGIWVARRERDSNDTNKVTPGNGTSYATAAIAGAAAVWIAYHGKDRLNAAKGEHSLAALFRFALEKAVQTPNGWDTNRYGPGILDLEKLLQADIDAFDKDQPRSAADADTPVMTLSRTIDRSPRQTRDVLRHLFGAGDPDALAAMYGAELERIAATRPADIQRILNLVDRRAPPSVLDSEISAGFSSRLQAAVVD